MATKTVNQRGSSITDPVRNFRFLVKWTNVHTKVALPTVGFSSVDGLAVAVDVNQIREGGFNATIHNIPMTISHNPVTFQKGVVLGSPQNWNRIKSLYNVVQGAATGSGAAYRYNIEIAVLGHPLSVNATGEGTRAMGGFGDMYEGAASADDPVAVRFMLHNAFPTQLVFSSLNAMDNALMVESMTVVHEGLRIHWSERDGNENWTSAADFDPNND